MTMLAATTGVEERQAPITIPEATTGEQVVDQARTIIRAVTIGVGEHPVPTTMLAILALMIGAVGQLMQERMLWVQMTGVRQRMRVVVAVGEMMLPLLTKVVEGAGSHFLDGVNSAD